MRHSLAVAAMAAQVAACGGGAPEVDTGGEAARWALDPVPALDIPGSGPDGDPVFLHAAAATRLSSGIVAVADPYASSIRFFAPSGEPTRRVGGSGKGPGEFSAPWWLRQCGRDTLFVWDYTLGRTTVMDGEGKVVRVFRQPEVPLELACSRNGAFAGLAQPVITDFPSEKTPHHRAPLWIVDAGGTVHAAGEVPAGENRPLGMMTRLALTGDRLYLGTGATDTLQVFTLDGKPAGTLSLRVSRRRATARNYERAIDEQVSMLPRGDREESRKMLLEIPRPRHLPSLSALFADPDGWIWAVVSGPGDPVTELRGVRSDGQQLADLRIPEDVRVFEVGSDYVLGAHENADGEQRIVMYSFRRGS